MPESTNQSFDYELNAFQFPRVKNFSTRAVHVGQDPEQWSTRATVPPIHMSVTYTLDDQTNYKYCYSSESNPSRDCLQECFASLDEAKHCLVFPSGSAATTCLFHLLSPGDHIVLSKHIYGGTFTLTRDIFVRHGITFDTIDFLDHRELRNALKPNTKIIFFETPTNPCLRIVDIEAVSDIAHKYNPDILVACDNTFLTPYFQRPLSLGVDVCTYSMTKFINGHTDIIMGALTFNDDQLRERLWLIQYRTGSIPSPYDCSMVQRSLRTLAIRMEAHFKNSVHVARFLETHPAVEKVFHPALKSHPDHDLALKQASGHSGMVSFWLKSAGIKENVEFLKKLKVILVQGSLGGVETIVSTPILLSAFDQPKNCREDIGVTENLVRLSVGVEDPDVLIKDLDQALNGFLTDSMSNKIRYISLTKSNMTDKSSIPALTKDLNVERIA